MGDYVGIALTKCFYCLKDNQIIMNTRLTKGNKEMVEEMNGKVVSFEPCPECAEHMKNGIIMITIDPSKSEPNWQKSKTPNPYRTGGFFVIKGEAIRKLLENEEELLEQTLKYRFVFIEHEAARSIGLFNIDKQDATG